jgi:hypothetical protein
VPCILIGYNIQNRDGLLVRRKLVHEVLGGDLVFSNARIGIYKNKRTKLFCAINLFQISASFVLKFH